MPTTSTFDLRVADLMTIDPIVVAIDATIEDAEELLRRNRITGLPVIEKDGRLAGVFSQTDLLYLQVPAVQALIRHHPRGVRVGEVMSTPPVTIDGDATLLQAARTMTKQRIHRLVAIDGAGRPIGVVSAMDFVALYAEDRAERSGERA